MFSILPTVSQLKYRQPSIQAGTVYQRVSIVFKSFTDLGHSNIQHTTHSFEAHSVKKKKI